MKIRNSLAILLILSCLTCSTLKAVEEKDWVNCWGIPVLPGTEGVPSVDVDEIDNYAISVTYALDGGRFGDQLTNYLKALWISWKYNLPFIYRRFEYSDQLTLSDVHTTALSEEVIKSFSAKMGYFSFLETEKAEKVFACLNKTSNYQSDKNGQLLWNIGLLTPFLEEHFCEKMDDEKFRSYIQKLVKPKNELTLVSLPKGRKAIAIHVRTGVGYDLGVNLRNMPTKFPPDTFYLSSLKQAVMHFKGHPLYVHIFTDHPEPAKIEEKFFEEYKSWGFERDVIFNCRRSGNTHTQNVLEDMFSMSLFDALIHPDSSLSRLAAIFAAPILEIKPSHWGEYRKDQEGNPLLDKQGSVIVDPLVIKREERGKPIRHMSVAPIESSMLFE